METEIGPAKGLTSLTLLSKLSAAAASSVTGRGNYRESHLWTVSLGLLPASVGGSSSSELTLVEKIHVYLTGSQYYCPGESQGVANDPSGTASSSKATLGWLRNHLVALEPVFSPFSGCPSFTVVG